MTSSPEQLADEHVAAVAEYERSLRAVIASRDAALREVEQLRARVGELESSTEADLRAVHDAEIETARSGAEMDRLRAAHLALAEQHAEVVRYRDDMRARLFCAQSEIEALVHATQTRGRDGVLVAPVADIARIVMRAVEDRDAEDTPTERSRAAAVADLERQIAELRSERDAARAMAPTQDDRARLADYSRLSTALSRATESRDRISGFADYLEKVLGEANERWLAYRDARDAARAEVVEVRLERDTAIAALRAKLAAETARADAIDKAQRDEDRQSPYEVEADDDHPDGCHSVDPAERRNCEGDGHYMCQTCTRHKEGES